MLPVWIEQFVGLVVVAIAIAAPFFAAHAAWRGRRAQMLWTIAALFGTGCLVAILFSLSVEVGLVRLDTGMEGIGLVITWSVLGASAVLSLALYAVYVRARSWLK